MKVRLPLSVLLSCLILALPSMSSVSYPQTRNAQTQTSITESNLLAITNSIDKAAGNRNIAGIVGPMAKDVKIKLIIVNAGREQELNFDRAQYAYYTRRGMQKRIAYQCDRKNVRVKISSDAKSATVTDDLYETLTIPQGALRAVTAETTIFNLRNGRILITSVEGRMRLY